MPIRIYALAKELKVDSKELVEVCTKAGVTGKGSALASLDDDEVTKVRAFLEGGNRGGAAKKSSAAAAPERPIPPSANATATLERPMPSKPPMLRSKPKPAKPESPPEAESEVQEPSPTGAEATPESPATAEPQPVETPPAAGQPTEAKSPAAEPPAAKAKPPEPAEDKAPSVEPPESKPAEPSASDSKTAESPPGSKPAGDKPAESKAADPKRAAPEPPRRPLGPLASARRDSSGKSGIKVITSKKKGDQKDRDRDKDNRDKDKRDKDKPSTIRLAAMPDVKQPPAKKESNEPKAQKPIMSLPKDVMRGAAEGKAKPLEDHIKQHEKKRKAAEEKEDKAKEKAAASTGAATPARSRRGKKEGGDESEDIRALAGSRKHRTDERKRRQRQDDEEDRRYRRRNRRQRSAAADTSAPRKGKVVLELPCTVRSFSEAAGVPGTKLLFALMQMGIQGLNINSQIDPETAELLAEELDVELDFRQPETLEESLIQRLEDLEDDDEDLAPRPPVVTFLGHVDHGKTSLLDRIIGIDVVKGEAGGITQHIRAYQVDKDGRKISFVDTPGHEAFTEMRARGANVTDIAVLVVAADDGIMPQTEEAISHARAAGVPIVVALNKIDLPTADENKAMQDLAAHDLLPIEWGGEIEVVKTSAITGQGIDDLLETLLLTAEIHEYQANPTRPAIGTCLEAQQEGNRGVVAKLIVKTGQLKVGDVVVCGAAYGRVKAMYDPLDSTRRIEQAGPSTPVNLIGLDIAPEAGQKFYVLDDIAQAREIASQREETSRNQFLSGQKRAISFIEFQERREAGLLGIQDEVATLNIILRADVRGSIEAIEKELGKLDHPEVKIHILQKAVGGVTVGDVALAEASDAVIIGFNVIPDESARTAAEQKGVEIRRYDIIYKVTEDIKAVLEGKLKPEEQVVELGRALVQAVFLISRVGAVAGCRVLQGTIERGSRIRVNRENRKIGDYPLDSLRREKDDVKEVREGYECGMKLSGFNDLKEGDVLEAYRIEEVARSL